MADKLYEAAKALCDAMETCHICEGAVIVEDYPVHCEDCSSDCDDHDEPNCTTLYRRHRVLREALRAHEQSQRGDARLRESVERLIDKVVGLPRPCACLECQEKIWIPLADAIDATLAALKQAPPAPGPPFISKLNRFKAIVDVINTYHAAVQRENSAEAMDGIRVMAINEIESLFAKEAAPAVAQEPPEDEVCNHLEVIARQLECADEKATARSYAPIVRAAIKGRLVGLREAATPREAAPDEINAKGCLYCNKNHAPDYDCRREAAGPGRGMCPEDC